MPKVKKWSSAYGPQITLVADNIPSSVLLFQPGLNEATHDSPIYSPEMAASILANSLKNSADKLLPIDIAHNSHSDIGDPNAHISVGWFNLRCDETGIWADNIQWGTKALDYLKNREFRFISPCAYIDDMGRVIQVIDFALTNHPAIIEQEPLVASKHKLENKKGLTVMSEENKELIQLKEQVVSLTKENKDLTKKIAKFNDAAVLDEKDKIIAELQKSLEDQNSKIVELEATVLTFQQEIAQKEKEQIVAQLHDISKEKSDFLMAKFSVEDLTQFVKFELESKPAATPPQNQNETQKTTTGQYSLSADEIKKIVKKGYDRANLQFATNQDDIKN